MEIQLKANNLVNTVKTNVPVYPKTKASMVMVDEEITLDEVLGEMTDDGNGAHAPARITDTVSLNVADYFYYVEGTTIEFLTDGADVPATYKCYKVDKDKTKDDYSILQNRIEVTREEFFNAVVELGVGNSKIFSNVFANVNIIDNYDNGANGTVKLYLSEIDESGNNITFINVYSKASESIVVYTLNMVANTSGENEYYFYHRRGEFKSNVKYIIAVMPTASDRSNFDPTSYTTSSMRGVVMSNGDSIAELFNHISFPDSYLVDLKLMLAAVSMDGRQTIVDARLCNFSHIDFANNELVFKSVDGLRDVAVGVNDNDNQSYAVITYLQ